MVAADVAIHDGSAPEFGCQHHHGVVQLAIALEVLEQGSHSLIHRLAQERHRGEIIRVGVPSAEADFDRADIAFDETSREEATLAKWIVAIALTRLLVLLVDAEGRQVGALHQADRIGIHIAIGPDRLGVIAFQKLGIEILGEVDPPLKPISA